MKNAFGKLLGGILATVSMVACGAHSVQAATTTPQKIGVVLVNHGSRSPTWRQALMDLEAEALRSGLKNGLIQGVSTAYMEYTEPSIATRIKEFDAQGYTDLILVPVFLTISSHTFDDIPTIVGLKEDATSMQVLKMEKIERYKAKANIHIAPALDFTEMLKHNILRRVRSLTKDAAKEGLVLIAYGDETYEKQWISLMGEVAEFIKQETGISPFSYGWCGHLVHYDPARTTDAINKVLAVKDRAIVVPVLVAHDEMFQVKIIGDGIAAVPNNKTRVVYKPDAILPEPRVTQWVQQISHEMARKVESNKVAKN